MKDGTEELMKFRLLVTELGLDPCYVGGILQFIWKFAAKNCPRGDIGKFSNDEIAVGIGYTGDPDKLIAALVKRKWIDEVEGDMRLIIHDWPEHAEDSVHRKLARRKQWFADGSQPSLKRLERKEKTALAKFYAANTCDAVARRAHVGRTACTPAEALAEAITEPEPEPLPEPLPTPEQLPSPPSPAGSARGSGVRIDLTARTLRDAVELRLWFDQESARQDGWVSGSESEWENVKAAAAKAVHAKGVESDVALCKWLIRGKHWRFLRSSDEVLAKEMARESAKQRAPPLALYDPPAPIVEPARTREQVINQIKSLAKQPP